MVSFRTALRLLTRVRLGAEAPEADLGRVAVMFPVVGALLGVIYWLAAEVCVWVGGRPGGLVVAAVAIPIMGWWITKARGLKGLMWFMEQWPRSDENSSYDTYWRATAFQFTIALRAVGTGLLVWRDSALWLVVVPTVAFAAFAESCRTAEPESDEPVPFGEEFGHWIVAAVVAFVVGALMHAFVGSLFSLIVMGLLVAPAERAIKKIAGVCTEPGRGALLELSELIVLLMGLFYFSAN